MKLLQDTVIHPWLFVAPTVPSSFWLYSPRCKYELGVQPEIQSLHIDSKTVVFIKANPGKKETTDGSGSHVIFFRDLCTFRGSCKLRKVPRHQKFKLVKLILPRPLTTASSLDYCKHDCELYIRSVRVSFFGITRRMGWYWSRINFWDLPLPETVSK